MNVIGLRSGVIDAVVRARAATEPLIQIIHSSNEKQSKAGSKTPSDLVTENETIHNSLLTTRFAELVLHTYTSNNQIQSKPSSSSSQSDINSIFIKFGLLDVVLRLVTTAEGLQPLALLIPILEDIKLNGQDELKNKSKKILNILNVEVIKFSSLNNEKLKNEKDEIIRLREELKQKYREILQKDEEIKMEKEELRRKDEENENLNQPN
ncbi:MAG: hypothetical protein EZS28_011841 [Streblomastix strix]|uniref:Uncharacterized protein n=1 Tax=Streblomastix strix TaxID=222440 RepID=A0A5J4WD79_9EUKA|nr:MAG: hypothetical protein EZS28_011841 [Streblomastix strix]